MFAYRESSLDELVILGARFELEQDDPEELTKRMQKQWIVKKATQPLGHQSAGCIFKNPRGMSAGMLIEQAGLKNTRIGGAEVSERHANFIVADEDATSAGRAEADRRGARARRRTAGHRCSKRKSKSGSEKGDGSPSRTRQGGPANASGAGCQAAASPCWRAEIRPNARSAERSGAGVGRAARPRRTPGDARSIPAKKPTRRRRLGTVRRLLHRAARRSGRRRPRAGGARAAGRALHRQRSRGLPPGDEQARPASSGFVAENVPTPPYVLIGADDRMASVARRVSVVGLSRGAQARRSRFECRRDDRARQRRTGHRAGQVAAFWWQRAGRAARGRAENSRSRCSTIGRCR